MPEEQQQAQETTLNCAGCGKQITGIKRYYRNGKYFCNKKCFKNKKAEGAKAEGGE